MSLNEQMEMTGEGTRPHSRAAKRRLWGGLRQQWRLLGLFEIGPQHEFYDLTCMMKEGLQAAVQNTIDNPPPDELSEEDFEMEVTQIHESFRMETFAGPVFAWLRRSLGMSERDYQQSLATPQGCYLQFISNSKSKADFFLTNDKRFFLKTQSKREVKFLLSNLKIYLEHLERYPHSLLVKFLGVHRIKIPHQRKKYFIVMQSVFFPDERIEARYDIKGCEVSRWTNPAPEGSQVIVVLKDLNFEGKQITLEQQQPWLLRQVEIDTAFLQRLNVLDYSLLLAHQPLHRDERAMGLSFASVIMRTTKSVNPGCSPAHSSHAFVPGAVLEEDSALLVAQVDRATARCRVMETYHEDGLRQDPADVEASVTDPGLRELLVQNRRLLPSTKNPLHVIDGRELRYFVGIIDIFTVYGFRKKLEHLWKRFRYPGQSFSTISPPAYAQRLCQWVQGHSQ
ncbi:phosphatidylinositol 4-phosphate 5-kinase-like protein 1 isoform X1 [Brienomyrus brachyistius]|uniref:phosphatidylinositol 4-phosphate 5-kinase-like protein 1 isoform X1 n=2 Tax=Brienomyrus brachyistius TaxID=42636 RepID=UPI0020B1B67D|nr:phosphatidylinositol 4-phosphate 5-kinase-like protein 1 isoform X1 [Brienomyrus brachyistius]